ncbi:hypothetical protein, partial [Nosocomiicoccus sp. HMSC067E10]|uniref:hypothetical protein n=1 Tax=Nosocomiicoccus sp. HMSC067E10 TaxID=1739271 RepID=UPI001AEFCEBD
MGGYSLGDSEAAWLLVCFYSLKGFGVFLRILFNKKIAILLVIPIYLTYFGLAGLFLLIINFYLTDSHAVSRFLLIILIYLT